MEKEENKTTVVNEDIKKNLGDDKNDKKRVANLNEENSDDEEVLLS